MVGAAGARFQAKCAQVSGDLGRGALLAVGRFRMGVEVAAPVDDLLLQPTGRLDDLGALRWRCVLRGGEWRGGKQGQQQRAGAMGEAHGGVLRRRKRRCYRARQAGGSAATAVGRPRESSAIITKRPRVQVSRSPLSRSSATSSTSTCIEVLPTPTTRAMVSTSWPWRIGRLKSTCSERAVTTVRRA